MPYDPAIVTIYFDFYGESFDPQEITERLKMKPTTQFKKGEPMPSSLTRSRRRDGWVLTAASAETFHIDDLLDELKAAVTATPEAIRMVASDFEVEAVVTCEIVAQSEVMPSVVFPPDFAEWVSARGATICVDISAYVLDDEETS